MDNDQWFKCVQCNKMKQKIFESSIVNVCVSCEKEVLEGQDQGRPSDAAAEIRELTKVAAKIEESLRVIGGVLIAMHKGERLEIMPDIRTSRDFCSDRTEERGDSRTVIEEEENKKPQNIQSLQKAKVSKGGVGTKPAIPPPPPPKGQGEYKYPKHSPETKGREECETSNETQ